MLSLVLKPLQQLAQLVVAHRSPRRLAVGFAIGMIIGLMPKVNLIVLGLAVLVVLLRSNVPAAMLGALVFSWIGVALDPVTHKLGAFVLSIESLQGFYGLIYRLPLGPWLGFQNTVVTGSLLLGLYFAYPVYWFSFLAFRRLLKAGEQDLASIKSLSSVPDGRVASHWRDLP